MKINRDDVVRVAELAYLDLSESELETYRAQIDEILEYISKLNELDTENVEPMAQVLTDDQTADATLRDDVVVPCGIAAEVLKQAPDPEPPFFRVPKVIERLFRWATAFSVVGAQHVAPHLGKFEPRFVAAAFCLPRTAGRGRLFVTTCMASQNWEN